MKKNKDFALLEPFWKEAVERLVLPNGLTLIVKPDHSAALASVQVWVKTGSVHEGSFLGSGVSHFLEHMLFKGTERRAGREISAIVQAHGGYINAYTTFDRTVYYIDLPAEHCGLAVDVLADAVLHSTLPAEEFEKEREVIRREIAMTRDDPDQRLSETLFATAFQAHPYKYPIIGHSDVFSALTRNELLAYYRTRYVPNNMVVVVAGAVDFQQVAAQVREHFGASARARLAPVFIPEEPMQRAGRAVHVHEEVELTRGGLGWQIPGLTHEDAPVLDLLATLLGSGDSSPLWQEVREKARLVHTIDAHCWNPGSVGLFFIAYTAEPKKRQVAVDAIHAVLDRHARSGFTPAQMAKAMRQLIVGEINTHKTMAGQASRLGAAEVVAGDLGFNREYFKRLGRVTMTDLRRAMRTYLVPMRLTEVSSNPLAAQVQVAGASVRTAVNAQFEELRLRSGARIVFQRMDHLPNVHLRLMAKGGPLWETPDRRGASALLATMLTKDTRKRGAAEVARRIESVGGVFYPSSGNNSIGVAAEVLPGDLKLAVQTIAEAVLTPAFRRSTLEIEREAQLAELRQEMDDVVSLGRKLTRRLFFGNYPLALDAQGEESGVRALATADLLAQWRALFTGPNTVLAVAGDFDPAALRRVTQPFLEKLTPRAAPPVDAVWRGPGKTGLHRERQKDREQAVVFHAFPGPSVATPDFYVGEVADELFSGMASRLFERVREEKGLAYFVRSSRVTGLSAGMFYFMAGTAPGKEEAVAAEIEAEVARVAGGGVEASELARCHARLVAARRQSMQTNSVRALNAGINALLDQPINDAQMYESRILSVTPEVLADFARRYLDPSKSLKVWV